MRDKFALTHELLKHLKDQKSITFEEARAHWWYNLKQDGGLRLTALGYLTLINDIELDCYRYVLKENEFINIRTVIELDQRLQMPYFIASKKGVPTEIIFFGSKEAMMARLYDDLHRFLTNYT